MANRSGTAFALVRKSAMGPTMQELSRLPSMTQPQTYVTTVELPPWEDMISAYLPSQSRSATAT